MQRSHDYRGRTEAANRALISVDPAGVGDGNPQVASECDAEAREIARRWVRESAAGEARAAIVGDVAGEHMGVLVDANVAHEVARQIVEDVARAPRRREVKLATGKAFLRPRYYARVATVLVSDRGHRRIARRIAHCGGFGERCMVDVGGAHSADEIHELGSLPFVMTGARAEFAAGPMISPR